MENIKLIKYFIGMMLSVGWLFFLGVTIIPSFQEIVTHMFQGQNNIVWTWDAIYKLLQLTGGGLMFGALWCVGWLGFKGFEKKFLDIWLDKT